MGSGASSPPPGHPNPPDCVWALSHWCSGARGGPDDPSTPATRLREFTSYFPFPPPPPPLMACCPWSSVYQLFPPHGFCFLLHGFHVPLLGHLGIILLPKWEWASICANTMEWDSLSITQVVSTHTSFGPPGVGHFLAPCIYSSFTSLLESSSGISAAPVRQVSRPRLCPQGLLTSSPSLLQA